MIALAPYVSGRKYDEWLPRRIAAIKKHISEKNDDYLILLVGETGVGKSTVGMFILEEYTPKDRLSIKQIGLSREEFADSVDLISEEPLPRTIMFDEANVSKRDTMTQFNKDLLDLYYSIRGKNFLHIWANPSLNIIDKTFINERINAILLITGKNQKKNKPRFYYWFKKEEILKIYDKYETLDLKYIKKYRKKYGQYRGWFHEYDGILKNAYLQKKDTRMKLKIKNFKEKYGTSTQIKRSDVCKKLGISDDTIRNHLPELTQNVDYFISATGRYTFSEQGLINLKARLGYKNKGEKDEVVE